MTLKTFFEKFDQLADAPNAVPKMRELILQLAVQGKLVPQDPNDEPAANLISQIAEEKRRLVAAKIIREKDEATPITEDELPFEAPFGWEWARLSSITRRIHYGYTASAKADLNDVRLLRITDIQNNFVDWPSVPGCEIAQEDVAQYQLERGDILVARTGGTVGKTYLVHDVPVVAVFASYLIRIQGGSSLFDRYLKLFLESPTYWVQLEEGARGAAQPNVNGQTLGRMVVSVPPLAEQRRIVAKVDELMALCDRLEAQQQEQETRHAALARASLARFADAPTPANLPFLFHPSYAIPPADLRKSILTLAVQGKLVHRVTCDGIGSDILKDAKVTEAPPDDVPKLPEHWTWARLGSIATRMDSGWSPACSSEPADIDEWGVLKTTAVQTLQYQEVQNKALPPSLSPRPEHEVLDGDILFTRAGPMNRVGILCVARPTRKKLMISDKIIRIHLVAGIDPDFAALAMNAGHSSTLIEGLKSGMAASQVNISQPKLRSVPIPVPPLAEQRRIVAKVEQLMTLVNALETQLAASRAIAANLLSALVAELTGTPNDGKVAVPSASTTGRRGRPRKS